MSTLEASKDSLDHRLILLHQELDTTKMDLDSLQTEKEVRDAFEHRSPSPSPAGLSAAGDEGGKARLSPAPRNARARAAGDGPSFLKKRGVQSRMTWSSKG